MSDADLMYKVLSAWVLAFALPFLFPGLFGLNKKHKPEDMAKRPWKQ